MNIAARPSATSVVLMEPPIGTTSVLAPLGQHSFAIACGGGWVCTVIRLMQ
jgi:hypothetical protein